MNFIEEVRQETLKSKNADRIPLIREKLGEKEFKEFIEAIEDPLISCGVIRKVLKSRGIVISESTLRKYRSSRELS